MIFTPAISLLSTFIYSINVSFSNVEIYFIVPILVVLLFQKKEIVKILKRLLFLNLFIIILSLVLVVQKEYYEALNIFFRSNLIILFNLAIFHSSNGFDIVRGFNILKFPKQFVSTIYFTLKMIDNLKYEFSNIKNTLKSRGFKGKTNLFTYQTLGNVLGLLFIKSIRKSQALNDSFTARGFDKKIYLNDEFEISKSDYILLTSIFIIIILRFTL